MTVYCERLASGLSGEPLNVASNVAFLVAAAFAWRLVRGRPEAIRGGALLTSLIVTMGIGSAIFHGLGSEWARLLDVIPIVAFQLAFLWIHTRDAMGVPVADRAALLGAVVVAALSSARSPDVLNGSLFYVPPLVVASGLAFYHHRMNDHAKPAALAALALFALALAVRTADGALCGAFPYGTHFLWHVLTPAVAYLFVRALFGRPRRWHVVSADCFEMQCEGPVRNPGPRGLRADRTPDRGPDLATPRVLPGDRAAPLYAVPRTPVKRGKASP